MRNVHAPLDIAFIRADGTFVDVLRMDPGLDLYGPDAPYAFALETRAGWFAEHGLDRQGRLVGAQPR